jgi:hypothetical protein
LPLDVAVMISPLYLLIPIQLYSIKWDRRDMFLVVHLYFHPWLIADDIQSSKALGSQKPLLLVEVETWLMKSLFRLASMKANLEEEVRAFASWIQGKSVDVASELPDSRSFFKSNPSIPFTAKFASTNSQTIVSVSSLEDVDGNQGGSGEGETDMDISDDERDDAMAVEPDIECGDAHMQVVERGNSEGGSEDGEGEDMSGDDQAIDMDTGEEVSESEDAEEVSHKPRALPKIPKRKGRTPRKAQEQKWDVRRGANEAGSSKEHPILLDDFFVRFFQFFSYIFLNSSSDHPERLIGS